jgi:hypothetical protein
LIVKAFEAPSCVETSAKTQPVVSEHCIEEKLFHRRHSRTLHASLTCPNHEVLFAELPLKIAGLLDQQGFHSKIVREIHQFVVEVRAIQG